MKIVSKKISYFYLIVALITVSGCGLTVNQKVAIDNFSTATVTFSQLTAKEFVKTRSDVVEMNTFRKKLGDVVKTPEGNLTLPRVKARIDAVLALKEYGELLKTLANTSKKDEVKQAADSFVTSLRKVKGVELSDEKAGAIGQIVQLFGGFVIEQQRMKALQTVVNQSHQAVTSSIDLVERSFNPEDEFWSLEYNVTIVALRGAAEIKKKTTSDLSKDLASQAIIADAFSLADSKKRRFETISASIIKGCQKLRAAEKELIHVIKYKDFMIEDIDSYVATIEDLIKIYKILEND